MVFDPFVDHGIIDLSVIGSQIFFAAGNKKASGSSYQ
jgi:hypothetical protein